MTDRLRGMDSPLQVAAGTIAELDSVFARARFARDFDACVPEFAESTELRLGRGRGIRCGRQVAPGNRVDCADVAGARRRGAIAGDQRPNHRRKDRGAEGDWESRRFRRRRRGFRWPRDRAVLPLFDRVLVDIGDEQFDRGGPFDVFGHMLNLKAMLAEATPKSLVLVDEMGTGTAPEEGAALAVALLEEFRQEELHRAGDHAP